MSIASEATRPTAICSNRNISTHNNVKSEKKYREILYLEREKKIIEFESMDMDISPNSIERDNFKKSLILFIRIVMVENNSLLVYFPILPVY